MSDNNPYSLTPAQLKTILLSVSTSKVDRVNGKQLSTHDFNSQWLTRLANAGVYARQDNNRHAVNGIFALAKDSTDEQIRAALTCFETKKVLIADDLIYCAENGSPLWDEATQALVWVTHNGGNLFNLIELSMTNYTELPRLRFASLRFNASTSLWSVTRPGQQERIAYHSERPLLATSSADGLLSKEDKAKLDSLSQTSNGSNSAPNVNIPSTAFSKASSILYAIYNVVGAGVGSTINNGEGNRILSFVYGGGNMGDGGNAVFTYDGDIYVARYASYGSDTDCDEVIKISSIATTSAPGLMSSADKAKLDSLDSFNIPDSVSSNIFLRKFVPAEWIHDDAFEYLRLHLTSENPDATEQEIEDMVNEYWAFIEPEMNAEMAFQIKLELTNYRAQLAGEELDLEAWVNAMTAELNQFGVSLMDFENRMQEKADANHSHSGYASYSHTHSASNITSGTIDIKRIPTGTDSQSVALGNHSHSDYAPSSHSHTEYAALKHSHSEYAAASHTHSDYATASHTHSEYAPATHKHTEYAEAEHMHTEYADVNHSHDDYAPISHSHDDYALANHTHTLTADDIPFLPASKITSGTLATSQIPSLAASKITSGTFSDARMPTSVIGKTTTSSVTSLPTTHALIVASISASASLKFSSVFAAGRQIHTIIKNTGSADITVTMPSSNSSYLCDVDSLTIPAGKFAEVNAISDGSTIYLRSAV